ncbi:hypothetical protein GCM10023185_39750 [Hymenobacter saemangeumensis]|uniref:Uncharacterized protein n=1 Tax=Hymenobacter saemangeumensis TaxID=1084522 RepID=A0ABP8IQV3_9BACT
MELFRSGCVSSLPGCTPVGVQLLLPIRLQWLRACVCARCLTPYFSIVSPNQ